MILVGCNPSVGNGFVHFGPQEKVVTDSASLEPDRDYLAEFRKLNSARISSFRDYAVGENSLSWPISADNFVGLKNIQQLIVRQLMGEDYVNIFFENALKEYQEEFPERVEQLELTTCFNDRNIYACRNKNKLMVFNVSTGSLLKLEDLFSGNFAEMFLTVMGDDEVNMNNFYINHDGLVFLTVNGDGSVKQSSVSKDVAKRYLNEKWKHLWQ